jgi:hypothetical protein
MALDVSWCSASATQHGTASLISVTTLPGHRPDASTSAIVSSATRGIDAISNHDTRRPPGVLGLARDPGSHGLADFAPRY